MRWPIHAALVIVVLATAGPALGGDEDDCKQGADNARRIAGCTRLIDNRGLSDRARAIAHNRRGLAYYRSGGNLDRAIADYTEALKIDAKLPIAHANRGAAWLEKRDNERAMADCNESIDMAPKFAPGYVCRGLAWRAKGDNDKAVADCDQAISLSPKLATGYNCRGLAFANKGETDRAIADYTEAIRIAPKYIFAYNNRGRAYASKGDQDHAIADFTEAISINPKFRPAYHNRGTAWSVKGDNTRAVADYTEATRLRPHKASTEIPNAVARTGGATVLPPTAEPPRTPAPVIPSTGIGRRVALVIGNSAYAAVAALPNPERDANSVAQALRKTGFAKVIVKNNATRKELVESLKSFQNDVDSSDWAVIYYAGHGIEIAGINYLIPVDAKLKDDRDVQDEAVPLERVLSTVENAKKLRLVILDACRDNPFLAQMHRKTASRSLTLGLGAIEPEGGVLVAYSAKHGEVALDGDGGGSPFATALVKRLTTPNLEIGLLFRLVRDDVLAATGKKQEPFVYGSLPGESLYFVQK